MGPRRHGDGGAYLWGRDWDSQRQDSDRMGQSSGLCLLRLITVLRPPHRGSLAAACPTSAPARGVQSWEGDSRPAGRAEGLPPALFRSSGYAVPRKEGGNTSKRCHHPTQRGPVRVTATSHPYWQGLRVSEQPAQLGAGGRGG